MKPPLSPYLAIGAGEGGRPLVVFHWLSQCQCGVRAVVGRLSLLSLSPSSLPLPAQFNDSRLQNLKPAGGWR